MFHSYDKSDTREVHVDKCVLHDLQARVSNGLPFMVMDEVKIIHDFTGVPGIGVSTSTMNVLSLFSDES